MTPLKITETTASDWAEILAGAESDLADAIAQTRDAEMTLRRCREQESQRRNTLESMRERVLFA